MINEFICICIICLGVIIGLPKVFVWLFGNRANRRARIIFILFPVANGLAWFVYYILSGSSHEYFVQIDPINHSYTPLSGSNSLSFIVFTGLGFLAYIVLGIHGRRQPPLLVIVWMALVVIGIGINSVLIWQLSDNSGWHSSMRRMEIMTMLMAPVIQITLSIFILLKVVNEEADASVLRKFKSTFLNRLNERIQKSRNIHFWTMLFLLPIFLIITSILVLFGQEFDSLTKVFTETATWHFSQREHPPFLDHRGHYLCTVAACGSPRLVKPLRVGSRWGRKILVNRQLQIANAFEELLMTRMPLIHRVLRRSYDRYGIPLSKFINNEFRSNLVYVLMKPLEWIFLIVIYSLVQNPESLIKRQYKL